MFLLICVPRVTIMICRDLCPLLDSHFIIIYLFLNSFYPQWLTNTTIMKMIPGTHFHHGKHNVVSPVGSHIAWGTCGHDVMVEADEILYGSKSKACCCQRFVCKHNDNNDKLPPPPQPLQLASRLLQLASACERMQANVSCEMIELECKMQLMYQKIVLWIPITLACRGQASIRGQWLHIQLLVFTQGGKRA
jgi:hypothetical protein